MSKKLIIVIAALLVVTGIIAAVHLANQDAPACMAIYQGQQEIQVSFEDLDKEAFSGEEEEHDADLSPKTMFVMAVATSIDALAVGISLAMAGNVNIWMAIALIGAFTFGMSAMGVKIGNLFGSRFEKKAQLAGGVILILLGAKILLEHLGVLV